MAKSARPIVPRGDRGPRTNPFREDAKWGRTFFIRPLPWGAHAPRGTPEGLGPALLEARLPPRRPRPRSRPRVPVPLLPPVVLFDQPPRGDPGGLRLQLGDVHLRILPGRRVAGDVDPVLLPSDLHRALRRVDPRRILSRVDRVSPHPRRHLLRPHVPRLGPVRALRVSHPRPPRRDLGPPGPVLPRRRPSRRPRRGSRAPPYRRIVLGLRDDRVRRVRVGRGPGMVAPRVRSPPRRDRCVPSLPEVRPRDAAREAVGPSAGRVSTRVGGVGTFK